MPKKTFVSKDDQELPDFYVVKIAYVTGKEEELEVAHHRLIEQVVLKTIRDASGKIVDEVTAPHPAPFFEFWTKDDLSVVITLSNIVSIHFDKNWSKVVRLYNKKQSAK